MRAIKFRAWLKDSHTMIDLGTHGALDFDDENAKLAFGESFHDDFTDSSTKNFELMQFTGLLDKDGHEIYEGDIIATGTSNEHVRSIVRIGEARSTALDNGYSHHYYGVYLEGSLDLEDFLLDGQMIILGNVYENPDLTPK